MILCLGYAADDTFRYSLARFRERGASFDAVDLGQVALFGEVSGEVAEPGSTTITLPSSSYVLADYTAVFCRLIDVSTAAPDDTVATRSAAQQQILASALSRIPAFVVNRPGGDASNFSKILH